jgi:hypothetical protein
MLNFTAANIPDLSSWQILDVCLLEIFQLLSTRVKLGTADRYRNSFNHMPVSRNIFRDILICLARRFAKSYLEIHVCTTLILTI